QVMSIPTLVVFKNGVLVNRSVGAIPKDAVLELAK
ncbi:MAG: thioredoxin, partial [Eubacterium sp.]